MAEKETTEQVFVGNKEISKYLSACFYALGQKDELTIIARGNNVKRAIDIAAILIRQYLINPVYTVKIDSESFEDRNVSTIEIVLKGKKKDGEVKSK